MEAATEWRTQSGAAHLAVADELGDSDLPTRITLLMVSATSPVHNHPTRSKAFPRRLLQESAIGSEAWMWDMINMAFLGVVLMGVDGSAWISGRLTSMRDRQV